MNIEIDQSGKIGKTNEDTVVAFSSDISFAVLIPRKVKQDCVKQLRAKNLSLEMIYFRLFAVALYFLLRRSIKPSLYILVDVEYPGREEQIKEYLYNLLRRANIKIDKNQLSFGHIGKHSKAHEVALETFRKKRLANIVLTVADILGELEY